MSFFVTVTFDLNQADTSAYPKIHRELRRIDFSKLISGKKKNNIPLPRNTFVAEFDNDGFIRSSEACEFIKNELKRIFDKHRVIGKYFVVSGKNWAWKIGKVN